MGTIAIYSRTLSVPFLFDDSASIEGNLSIRKLRPIWPVLSPPSGAGVAGRPLLNLSYALNHAAGGTAVSGYHLVNLLIHVLAGLTLFALVRSTLRRPVLIERFGSAATPLALAVSAIWAWHPVQTVSVTYLSQRAESLMGLFYLLTVCCFVRGAEADAKAGGRIWCSLSVLACLCGVATKEIIVTAPLVVFLYDRTFISGSFSGALRRHWPIHLALAATWLPLAFLMTGIRHRGIGDTAWWSYGIVECRVVVKYLLLAFWPNPLVFDRGKFVPVSLSAVWPFALVLVSLLTLTVVALRRSPAIGFAACWFFLILAPTSSIISIAEAPMAENRLYLPLAGAAAFAVIGAFSVAGRRCLPVFAIAATALALAAARRNEAYLSEQGLWSETVARDPGNARALNNLACVTLLSKGRTREAIAEFEEALRLRPNFPEARDSLARALADVPGRLNEAIAQCEEALREDPNYAGAHSSLGYILAKLPGRLIDAIAEDEEALRLKPDLADAHDNLANALETLPGRLPEALAHYGEALRINPNYAEAHNNFAVALGKVPGRLPEALAHYEQALRINPDFAEAHINLALELEKLPGRLPEAVAHFEQAARIAPNDADIQNDLAVALAKLPDRLTDAVAHFELALRLSPDDADLHYNLANQLMKIPGRVQDAISQYEEALRIRPDFTSAHFNLAVADAKAGRYDDAFRHLERVLVLDPENSPAREILERIRAAAK